MAGPFTRHAYPGSPWVPFRVAALAALIALAGCGARASADAAAGGPAAWFIGPIIEGRDYSRGMPLHPAAGPGGSWYIDLPQAPGSVHYLTFSHGSLAGKHRLVMRYRVAVDPDVRIVPVTAPNLPSIVTLYFQRRGDDWSGEGKFEAYRWYATFASQSPITAGEHEIVAPLDGAWTAVISSTARNNPAAFRDAISSADQVGFVLGGGDGYGHGVYATGRARLIVAEFRVE
jgi:hypothetical protein